MEPLATATEPGRRITFFFAAPLRLNIIIIQARRRFTLLEKLVILQLPPLHQLRQQSLQQLQQPQLQSRHRLSFHSRSRHKLQQLADSSRSRLRANTHHCFRLFNRNCICNSNSSQPPHSLFNINFSWFPRNPNSSPAILGLCTLLFIRFLLPL